MKKSIQKAVSLFAAAAIVCVSAATSAFADSIVVTKNARLYGETFDGFNGTNPTNPKTTFNTNVADELTHSYLPGMVSLLNGNKTTVYMNSELSAPVNRGKVKVEFDFVPQYWSGAAETNNTIFQLKGAENEYNFSHILASNGASGTDTAYFDVGGTHINNRTNGQANFIGWGARTGGGSYFIKNHVTLTLDLGNGTAHMKIGVGGWENTTFTPPENISFSELYEGDITTGLYDLESIRITSSATAGAFYMGIDNVFVDVLGSSESVKTSGGNTSEPDAPVTKALYSENFTGFNGTNPMNENTSFSTSNADNLYNSRFLDKLCLNTNDGSVWMKGELSNPASSGTVDVEFDYIPAYWNVAGVTGSTSSTVFDFCGGGKSYSLSHELNVGATSNATPNSSFSVSGDTISNISRDGNFNAWNYGIRDDVYYITNHIKVTFDLDNKTAHVVIGKAETNTAYIAAEDAEYTTICDKTVDIELESLEYIKFTLNTQAASTAKIGYYRGFDNISVTNTYIPGSEPTVITKTLYSENFTGFNGTNPMNENTSFSTSDTGNLYNSGFSDGKLCLNTNDGSVWMKGELSNPASSGTVDVEFDYIPAYWNVAGVTGSTSSTVFDFCGGGKSYSFSHELNVGATSNATPNSSFSVGGDTISNVSSHNHLYAWNYRIQNDVYYITNHIKVTFDLDNKTAHIVIGKAETNTAYVVAEDAEYTTICDKTVDIELESLEYIKFTLNTQAASSAKIGYYRGFDNISVTQQVEVGGAAIEGSVNEDTSGNTYETAAVDTVKAFDGFTGDEYNINGAAATVSCHVNRLEVKYTSPMSADGMTSNIAVKDGEDNDVPIIVSLDRDKYIIEFVDSLSPSAAYTLKLRA